MSTRMSAEGRSLDLTKAVLGGATLDDLLDFHLPLGSNYFHDERKPAEPVPSYKPSLQIDDIAEEKHKPGTGKPYITTKIPIEHRKHLHFACELCGQPPKFMCSACKETYYCCEKHCLLDFHAIHKFVCVKLMIVRNPEVKHGQWRRFSKEEISHNIRMRKVILLHIANNVSHRHLIRGNYSSAIPCSLLAQKLINEMYGLHCVEMVRPYLVMAEAYLARRKLERSRFYTGLVKYIKTHYLNNTLPKNLEMELQRAEANQLVNEKKFDEAKVILCTQIADICLQTGTDHHELLPALFLMGNCAFLACDLVTASTFYDCILLTNLLREIIQGSLYLHQSIEEDLNPEVKQDKKLGLLQKQSYQWAHVMSEKDYKVYIRRETILMYLRTIWIQFGSANRNEFVDIFPSLLYSVSMTLLICRQWEEASEMYSEAIRNTPADRQTDFRAHQAVLSMLHKHILHRKEGASASGPKDLPSQADKQCVSAHRPLWRPELVKVATPDMSNEDDELGGTLQRIVKKIQLYQNNAQLNRDTTANRKCDLQQMGLI